MGLLDRFKPGIRDGVADQAEILRMAPTTAAIRQEGRRDVEYEFALRLASDGRELELSCRVPHAKLPALGQTVPVTVSASDRSRAEIDFERMPDTADRFRASAEAAQRGDAAGAAEALGYELRDPPD